MKIYKVSFKYSDTVWCANMVLANNAAVVAKHYGDKYEDFIVSPANDRELESAKRRGMPIIKLEE